MFDYRSGPAGYTAAIYASRANFEPGVVHGMQMGWSVTTTTEVENFLDTREGVTGPVMMEDMRKTSGTFQNGYSFQIATDVDFPVIPRCWAIDGEKVIEADAVISCNG